MANPEHLAILKQGVETWNQWRSDHREVKVDLSEANLKGADLEGAHFQAIFIRANLIGENIIGPNLSRADLSGANLSEANLLGADLTRANLKGADLHWTVLLDAKLLGADLREGDLQGATLMRANLREADLFRAKLRSTDLSMADLSGANLSEADLLGADLTRANLMGANLSKAFVVQTIFGDIDLRGVKGLLSIQHRAPSTIGIDTIYKSHGEIPEEFLRGAGVPEPFVTHMKALVGAMDPIQFYSCFISYSTKDQDFAERLHADLQSKGVRCWFAPHDMQAGKKIHEQIDEAIRLYDRLLLVLSPNSVNSEWVNTEISKARKQEIRDKRRMLFPVRLIDFGTLRDWECFDADTGKDSAREIREYFIPDFSNWKDHDSYQTVFQRLLSDLKAEAGKDASTKMPPQGSGETKKYRRLSLWNISWSMTPSSSAMR